MTRKRASLLAHGVLASDSGFAVRSVLKHCKHYHIVEVLDEDNAGADAGIVVSGRRSGVKVVDHFGASGMIPEVLIALGPLSPTIPDVWRRDIEKAARGGVTIISGLGEALSSAEWFIRAARSAGAPVVDLLSPVREHTPFVSRMPSVKVVLTVGTDFGVGELDAAVLLHRTAGARGVRSAFLATSPAGMLLGANASVPVGSLPSESIAGEIENEIQRLATAGYSVVFVEGRASISHPVHGPASLAILHGSRPSMLVYSIHPFRNHMWEVPAVHQKYVRDEREIYERLYSGVRAIGIEIIEPVGGLSGKKAEDFMKIASILSDEHGIPAGDMVTQSRLADRMLDALL